MVAQISHVRGAAPGPVLEYAPRAHGRRVLMGLLSEVGVPILVMLSEKYGLKRVPGLGKKELIQRIFKHLDPEALARLEEEIIAARFGQASVASLLDIVLENDKPESTRKPRTDQISTADAVLVEGGSRRWVYTMRGHDVVIDHDQHVLQCDCPFFAFAAPRRVLCKHLATAFKLLPAAYAREVLIDLAVARRYGGPGDRWEFESSQAA